MTTQTKRGQQLGGAPWNWVIAAVGASAMNSQRKRKAWNSAAAHHGWQEVGDGTAAVMCKRRRVRGDVVGEGYRWASAAAHVPLLLPFDFAGCE